MTHSRKYILDLLRACAALEVVGSHLRTFLFRNLPELQSPSVVTKVFYYMTGFAHEAVVVFFVLSGYFVGGSVISSKGDAFWPRYLIQRVSRLWIVLVPSLFLTLFWNSLGSHTGGSQYLLGGLNPPINVAPHIAVDLGWRVLLGNALFLQTILVPTYGDNSPLWSLANEFWYYLMFPLLWFGLRGVRKPGSLPAIAQLILGLLLLLLLRGYILQGFIMWILGVLVAKWERQPAYGFLAHPLAGTAALASFALFLHLARMDDKGEQALNFGIAASLACSLPLLIRSVDLGPRLGGIAAGLSNFSYTLYLVHFSFISFFWYTFVGTARISPSLGGACHFILFFLGAIGYAFAVSTVFERRTNQLRELLGRTFGLVQR